MDYDKDFEDGFEYTSMGALHYMHHPGVKEKMIFLHGLGGNTKVWGKLVQFLPDDLDVFLLDLLGHGESDAPEIDYSISNQFQALREFIAMQNNGDSFIFGHSYGGWIAAYYASQPYTCKGIILEDAAGLKQQFDTIKESGNEAAYKENLLKTTLNINNNKEYVFKNIIESNFGNDQLTPEVLAHVSVRTQIIWGSDDKLVDKSLALVLQKDIKGSTLSMLDGVGHEPHFTHPEEVSKIIMGFIRP